MTKRLPKAKNQCTVVHPKGYECDREQGHDGNHRIRLPHHCHWPDCKIEVPPSMWGCKTHWFRLPKRLRDRIWATYVPGQEITKTPSKEYVEAAMEVQRWIRDEA